MGVPRVVDGAEKRGGGLIMGSLRDQRITYGVKAISTLEIDVDKDWGGKKITNLGAPTNEDDAATKKYIDNRIQMGAGSTDGSGDATITFPTSFASTPKVFLQGKDASAKGIVLDIVSKDVNGFVVKARKITDVSSGGAHSHIALKVYGAIADSTLDTEYIGGSDSGGRFGAFKRMDGDLPTSTNGAHSHSAIVLAADFDWLAMV